MAHKWTNQYFFDLATATTIVTLNYLALFRKLLFASETDMYFLPDYGPYDYIAGLVLVLGLSGLCIPGIRVIRKVANPAFYLLASFLVFLALVNPLNFIRNTHYFSVTTGLHLIVSMSMTAKVLSVLVACVSVVLFVRFYWPLFRAVRMLFVECYTQEVDRHGD